MIDTCINIFCCGFPKQSDTVNYYKSLSEYKIFEKIGEKIYGKGNYYFNIYYLMIIRSKIFILFSRFF